MTTISTYEVRACWDVGHGNVESASITPPDGDQAIETAESFGIYKNLPDGRQEQISDHDTLEGAYAALLSLEEADWNAWRKNEPMDSINFRNRFGEVIAPETPL